uniref:Uncharacterized protein n=1 Tax=Aggregatibacter actinomycetemcomitans TaxID=714 RepID=S4W6V6_AGGAC|nr:hypothetical protein pS23A_0020 [Aggregatibacter actinomycetemcomitans]
MGFTTLQEKPRCISKFPALEILSKERSKIAMFFLRGLLIVDSSF